MLAWILAATLSQAPSGATVLVTRRVDTPAATASLLADQVDESLRRKLSIAHRPAEAYRLLGANQRDAISCGRNARCVAELGRLLQVATVIALEVGSIQQDLTVNLTAVRSRDGEIVASHAFLFRAAPSRPLSVELEPLVQQLASVSDRPLRTELAPLAPTASAPQAVAEGPPARKLPWVLGGTAVVAGAVGGGFAIAGFGHRAQLAAPAGADFGMTESQARALARRANSELTVAAAAAGVAVALAVAALGVGLGGSP